MTSALYLEHYLDGLEQLPNELQRNFILMRELDTRAQTLMKGIDVQSNEFMSSMLKEREGIPELVRKEKLTKLQELFNKAKEYGDDKVQLAIQTYELVDKHIRRLDSDLARFEGEIQDKTLSARCKSEETVGKRGRKKGKDTKSTGKRKRAPSSEDELRGNGGSNGGGGNGNTAGNGIGNNTGGGMGNTISGGSQKVNKKPKVIQEKENRKNTKKTTEIEESLIDSSGLETTHPSDVLDMPVDPNEPTYCLCHQVSYGEMIGCDNPDCPIEWFHFACVGLTIKPKGKWFCPKCSQDRKKK